jgi:hypothetical protein
MIVVCIVLFPPVAKPSLIRQQAAPQEVELTVIATGASLSDRVSYPSSIKAFIKSAGQTRLSGALVKASLDGLLPSGKATMW